MAWILRYWQAILSAFQGNEHELRGWVEPSNAITRAILAGAVPTVAARPATAVEPPAPTPETARPLPPVVEAPAGAEVAPAARSRRRRASRAA